MISSSVLLAIMPGAGARVAAFVQPLIAATEEFDINSARRVAAFLAQIAHESGELRYVLELASGAAYEGRRDLGNTQAGDGERYKGRGLLQATGRAQYQRLCDGLNVDVIATPALLETPPLACRSAAYIWGIEMKLNGLADSDAYGSISHRINGGYNGLDSRITYWLRARRALQI